MESIIIYEDEGYRKLLPLTYNRPVFDLRCGINTIREKIIREYNTKKIVLFCRDYLKETLLESDNNLLINQFTGESALIINGRLLANGLKNKIPPDGEDCIYTCKGEVTAVRVSGDNLKKVLNSLKNLHLEKGINIKSKEINVDIIEYSWDLIQNNSKEIESDFSIINKKGDINGTAHAEEMGYPEKDGITYLLGSQYMPVRKEFWDVQKKVIKENLESIMITFGGVDPRNMTIKTLKLLTKYHRELTKQVVIGKEYKAVEQIESLKDEKTEFIYHPDADEMKKIMIKSDIAISAGGQTLYELARVGVPTIAVAVSDNQLNNIKGLQKAGFAENAGWWQDNDVYNNIKYYIREFSNVDKRLNSYRNGRRLYNGKGSNLIVEFIIKNFDFFSKQNNN